MTTRVDTMSQNYRASYAVLAWIPSQHVLGGQNQVQLSPRFETAEEAEAALEQLQADYPSAEVWELKTHRAVYERLNDLVLADQARGGAA